MKWLTGYILTIIPIAALLLLYYLFEGTEDPIPYWIGIIGMALLLVKFYLFR